MDTLLPCLISTDKSSLRVFVVLFISSITEFSHISNQFLLLGNREQLDPIGSFRQQAFQSANLALWNRRVGTLGFRQSINLILWNLFQRDRQPIDIPYRYSAPVKGAFLLSQNQVRTRKSAFFKKTKCAYRLNAAGHKMQRRLLSGARKSDRRFFGD